MGRIRRVAGGVCVGVLLVALPGQALRVGGNAYPSRVRVAGHELRLVGAGTREVTFLNLDVYTMGVYRERPGCSRRELVHSDETKLLQMDFVRDVPGDKMMSGLTETLARVTPRDASPALRAQIRRFVGWFRDDIPSGSRARIVYVPGQGTSVYVNGARRGTTLPGRAFQIVLFSVWFHQDTCCPGLMESVDATCRAAAGAD